MAIRNTLLGGEDWQDTNSTLLDGDITDSVTTITVDSTTGFKTAGLIRIGAELIAYTGVTATTFTGCTRGQFDTSAVAHSDNDPVLEKEVLTSTDINDTFDAAVQAIYTNPAWWLNSELYDVYDDFESYSVGAFTTNAKWTVTGTATIASGDIFGEGTSKHCSLNASISGSGPTSLTYSILSLGLEDNKHTFAKIKVRLDRSGTANSNHVSRFSFQFGGQTKQTIIQSTGTLDSASDSDSTAFYNIFIQALGSENYNVYVGSQLIHSNVSEADPNILIESFASTSNDTGSCSTTMQIDDVRQSKYEVQ